MRRYLLDSGPLAAYLPGRKQAVDFISPWILDQEAATSQLVYAEIIEYIKSFSNYARHKRGLKSMLDEVHPYYLTYPILERYADIRRSLRPPFGKGLIGDVDTLIAATALEHNLTVVTVDRDFERVPGLKVMLISLKG
ncbi:MAG: type II toxin-antitoxin system VapC family toxin [Ktedonobacteraceae bacterium]